MLPTVYDLSTVEHRYVELRAEAAAYRMAQAARPPMLMPTVPAHCAV